MIGLGFVYLIAGIVFAGYAGSSLADRRWRSGAFWALLALSFLAGDRLGDLGNGALVLILVVLATIGLDRRQDETEAEEFARGSAERYGNRLFLPALIVPVVAVGGTFVFKAAPGLIDARQATLVALATGVLIATVVAMLWLRPSPATPVREGRRLMDAVSWAALLPQMLAALGALFAVAGVGETIGGLAARVIPPDSLPLVVLAFGGGMAVLTMAVGNAFAAFPVMMAAIGLPLLVHGHHGNPAAVAALGMLCGFCGTLLTPMAANFNLVPAALLGLEDRYGVIRAQAPTALPLLAVNLLLLYWLAFP